MSNQIDRWLSDLKNDPGTLDALRGVALKVLLARAASDAEFATLLRNNAQEAFREAGVEALLASAPAVVVAANDALVLRLPAKRGENHSPRMRQKDPDPGDPGDPGTDPSPVSVPFRGSASHGASNPFSGGHKGYDIWVVTLPVGVEYGQIGFADDTGQISLGDVEVLVTANAESRQTTLRIHMRWWYNMWSTAHYDFAVFGKSKSNEVDYHLDQDDSAPKPEVSWSTGRIFRFIDGNDLDGWIQITPA